MTLNARECNLEEETQCILWAYGVVVSMFGFHRSDRGSNSAGRVAVKFHNVYDYIIVRHPWQVSENHKPQVHPNHEGNWLVSWVPDETQD